MADRRILFVHAHPDDESIETGATMARFAAEGAHVCLVTCTRGEEGEVIPEDLRHLTGDALGDHRAGELARACAALGVTDRRFLGGEGRWRDSGMAGMPSGEDPRCFRRADLDEATAQLAGVVREVRPQVIVTYDANGFYGHPDHIQAHRVAWRAFQTAAGDASFYATAVPVSQLTGATGGGPFTGAGSVAAFGFGVPDEEVTARVAAGEYQAAKLAAMRAHATQITVKPPFYALSDDIGLPVLDAEYYTLLAGRPVDGLFEAVP